MVQPILRRTYPDHQTRLHLALTPENWLRDGARAADANNNVVGPVSKLACKFSILGLLQHHFGYGAITKAYFYRALLAHKLPPKDNIDKLLTLEQANTILDTYFSLKG